MPAKNKRRAKVPEDLHERLVATMELDKEGREAASAGIELAKAGDMRRACAAPDDGAAARFMPV